MPIQSRLVSRLRAVRLLAVVTAIVAAPLAVAASIDAAVSYRPDAHALDLACREASAGACSFVVARADGPPHRVVVNAGATATLDDVRTDTLYCVGDRTDLSWSSCPKTVVSPGTTRYRFVSSD